MSTCSSVGFAVSSDSFHLPLAELSCHPLEVSTSCVRPHLRSQLYYSRSENNLHSKNIPPVPENLIR